MELLATATKKIKIKEQADLSLEKITITDYTGKWSGCTIPDDALNAPPTEWKNVIIKFEHDQDYGDEEKIVKIVGDGISVMNDEKGPFNLSGTLFLKTGQVTLSKQHYGTWNNRNEYNGYFHVEDGGLIKLMTSNNRNGHVHLQYKGNAFRSKNAISINCANSIPKPKNSFGIFSKMVKIPGYIDEKENFATSVESCREARETNAYIHRKKNGPSSSLLLKCKHPSVCSWDLSKCSICNATVSPERLKFEQDFAKKVETEDRENNENVNHEKMLHQCGVRSDWLVAFTYAHNCWNLKTYEVVRDIIIPATKESRIRYANLNYVSSFTGAAEIFISHCWGGTWGDLVMAAIVGGKFDRVVWIDIFAVRQWPGNTADLNFRGVINKCKSLIVAVSTVKELTVFLQTRSKQQAFLTSAAGSSAKKKIAFFRLWCIVELSAAIVNHIPVIIRGGIAIEDDVKNAYMYNTDGAARMMSNLLYMVNAEQAECAVPSDYVREMKCIKQQKGGITAVNTIVSGVISGAVNTIAYNIMAVDSAVSGEYELLQGLPLKSDKYLAKRTLRSAASGGRVEVLKWLLFIPEVRLEIDTSLSLWLAVSGSFASVVQILLAEGADSNVKGPQSRTPLFKACEKGLFEIFEVLMSDKSVDVNKASESAVTPLMIACKNGHSQIADKLIDHPEILVNGKSSEGWSALHFTSFYAASFPNSKEPWLQLSEKLVDKGADENDIWRGRGKVRLPTNCKKQCPGKHGLAKFLTPHQTFGCDLCGKRGKIGSTMYGCDDCNFDVCAECWV